MEKGAPQENTAEQQQEAANMMGEQHHHEEEAAQVEEKEEEEEEEEVVGVHVQALDEVVTVNSFFTAAVFIGLTQSNDRSLVAKGVNDPCYATTHVLRQLVLLEVLAFSCFLMSSLVAQGLKLHLALCRLGYKLRAARALAAEKSAGGCWKHCKQQTQQTAAVSGQRLGAAAQQQGCAHPRLVRLGVLATSLASLCGTAFLLLSIVIIIQLRLGMLSCDSMWAKMAAIPLILLVSLGVSVFITSVYVAFRT